MSTTAQKIYIEVLSLSRKSRAEIAERILASLEEQTDRKAEAAWEAVIRRRRTEVHTGKARVRPAEDVI
jgi:putative addiction module component (TIGR02574 family)